MKNCSLATSLNRCEWVTEAPLYIDYHDNEWGVPIYDSQKLFEFLILEGMQAGLSWITILKKRDNYRLLFDQFDPQKIAIFNQKKVEALLKDQRIIRNRLKVNAIIKNAKAYLKLEAEGVSFSEFLWGFVDGKPIQNHWVLHKDIPAHTPLSDQLSKVLKKRGFSFVGSTICYAFMQAVGMVNDHLVTCYKHKIS